MFRENRASKARRREADGKRERVQKEGWAIFQEKLLVQMSVRPVPRMDTHGRGEDPKVSERTIAKELCKMTP